MALDGTYTGLQASIADWLHRTDMTSVIPDLVILAEARIARDLRLRRQISTTTLSSVASTASVSLPTDYLEVENISCSSGGVERNMEFVTLERLNIKYPEGSGDGVPVVYTLEGDTVRLGPVPDAVYSLPLVYYARISPLATTATNWLLQYHPNVYLFGALAESADYTQSDQIAKWEGKYAAGIKSLQDSDDRSMYSGAALRVRAK